MRAECGKRGEEMATRGFMARAAAFAATAAAAFAACAADVTVSTVFGDDITGETRVVTGVSVTETDPTVPAWAKSAEPPATGDFTTNNTALVGTVANTITNEVTKSFVEGLGISGDDPADYADVRRAAFGAVRAENGSATNLQVHGVLRIWDEDGEVPLVIHPYYSGKYFWFENGRQGVERRQIYVEFPTDREEAYVAFHHEVSSAAEASTNYTDTATNGLPTVEYVDEAIDRLAAYYITANARGDAFPTLHALTNAAAYWSGGEPRTPTRNDYAVVLADESHGGAEWRYVWGVASGGGEGQWEAQYAIETNDYDALSNRPQINGVTLGGTNNVAQGLGLLGTAGGTISSGGINFEHTGYHGIHISASSPFALKFESDFPAFASRRALIDLSAGNGVLAYSTDIKVKSVKRNGTPLTPDAYGAVDVLVPTATSGLVNDSGFITSDAVPSLAGRTFDFETMEGMYEAVAAIVEAMGGTVTNNPTAAAQGN